MNPVKRRRGERGRTDPGLSAAWDQAYEKQGRLWGGVPFPVDDLPAGGRILELGCGNGKLLSRLGGGPHDCLALDASPRACRLAQTVAGDPAIVILTADARAIPLRAGSLDAIVAYHIVSHLVAGDRTSLVREAARVLRKGGRLLFCDFAAGDFRAGRGTEIEERTFLRGNGIATHYFTEDEVRGLFLRFRLGSLATVRRQMKVRGMVYPRAEITATLVRE